MRIKRIYIEKYKNLIDFELNFDEHISILIGKNGSGKSNFQEAIIKIFQFLDPNITSRKPFFNFEVDFEYNKVSYTYSSRDYIRDYKNSNFPKNIYYYSNTPKKIKNQKGFSIKVSNISLEHYKVVLLSLWFSRLTRHKELLGKFNIQSIDGFSFKWLSEVGRFYGYRLGNKHKLSYFNLSSLEEMHEVFGMRKISSMNSCII